MMICHFLALKVGLLRKSNKRLRLLLTAFFCPFMLWAQPEWKAAEVPLISNIKDTAFIVQLIEEADQLKATDQDSALNILGGTFRQSLQVRFTDGIVNSLVKIGNIYREQSRFAEALKIYKKALGYCDTLSPSKQYLTSVYANIGSVYNRQGQLQQAVGYYHQAAVFAERHGSLVPVEMVFANLSAIYGKMEQLGKANYYSDKAEALFRQREDKVWLGTLLNNKGVLRIQEQDTALAIAVFTEALQLGREFKLQEVQLVALNNLADIYLRKKQPEQALSLLEEAGALNNGHDPYLSLGLLFTRGQVYEAQKDLTRARALFEEVCLQGSVLQVQDMVMEAHERLADLYAVAGKPGKALAHYRAYMKLKDSLRGKEVARDINLLEVKYRTAEKDKALIRKELLINQQQRSMERQSILIITISIIALLILGLSFISYRHYRSKQGLFIRQQEISQLRAMIRGEEKERSRLARELHDGIGGMLASIKMNLGALKKSYPAFEGRDKLERISGMLQDTSSEVRKTAHNLMPDVLTKYSLQEALGRYCDQVSASHELQVELQFHGIFPVMEKSIELILYRMAQELIQNIIKHAQASYAAVQVMLYENRLSLTVEDNGAGFDIHAEHLGSGLDNLRYRVEGLQGTLSVSSTKDRGTTVHIQFDYEKLKFEQKV